MRVPSTDGVILELHDLGGDGPNVLVAHATGFCAGAYRPFAARLAGHGFHVWALDFRAHGASSTPTRGDLSWHGMADDVLAVADAIGSGPLLGYGHSMGGACLLAAELRRPETLQRAVIFEPIILPGSDAPPGGNQLATSARRRRMSFPTRPDALARYAGRPPLGTFRADALAAYVEHGFVDNDDGTVTLACDPEHEAAVFEAPGKPLVGEVGGVSVPVVVGCGERDPAPGPADFAPAVAAALPQGSLVRYPHLGHFGPFQDPDTMADDAAVAFAGS